ncbi:hypothetical protein FOZ63_017252 [Perkinsus olseni]|nr:hypothetical protein FOZ63_017252 [Perkinsus olseni]
MVAACIVYGSRVVPFKGRELEVGEKETSDCIKSFLENECIRPLQEKGLIVTAVLTDNAANVSKARDLVASDLSRQPAPGGGTICLSVGCLSHQNALVAKYLMNEENPDLSPDESDSQNTPAGQFGDTTSLCSTTAKFLKQSFINRLYISMKGTLVPTIGTTRWLSAVKCLRKLLDNWHVISNLLEVLREEKINELNDKLTKKLEKMEDLWTQDNRNKAERTYQIMLPLAEMNDFLQADDCTLFEAIKRIDEVYTAMATDDRLSRESQELVRAR